MSTHTPQPPSPNHLPAVLLFLAAIGVPGAAAFKFADTISKNPWQAFAIALLYEIGIVALAFLRKVWQHLEDEWSKGTADWVNNLVKKQWFSYKRYYARFLTFQHRDFDIKGLSTQSIYTLELEQVFVDLSIDPKPMHQVSSNPFPLQPAGALIPEELRMGSHSLWSYLTANQLKNQHVVILGAPGSGKTTLLKHLALTLVNHKKRHSLSRDVKGAYRLPFLLFLREHAENIHTDPHFSLTTAIQNTLERWERSVPEGWVRRQLSRGKCLLLLDGLDEVGDVSLRAEVVKWVQQQMQTYATNRFLVSSRPFGYRSNPLSGMMVLDVRPFTFEQIQRFVHNWYRANEVMSSQKDDPGVRMRANVGAQDLVRRIQQASALSSMAVNPLLLTMIATIHRYRSTLPGKRVELYAEICDVFLGKRQQARDMKVDLSPAQCVRVLQPLAYEMMQREQREISTLAAQKIIQEPLKLVHEQMTPEAFLQMVENMSGLLLEREQGKHYFAHLTFQEYLAATFIHDQGREAELLAHLGESWWEETTRLYCAQTDATTVIAACLNHPTLSTSYLMLAFECHEEALLVQPTIKPQLDRILEQGAEDADPQRRKVVAETLLKRRLKEMVPLQEGIYPDTSLILCAEYQSFLDEQRAQDRYYQPDHWTSFQFSSGQALLPIVGVRPLAAQAFCDWLTDREQGIWQYRLPRPGEYQPEKVLVRPEWLPSYMWNTSHGYWQEKGSSFEWIRQFGVIRGEMDSREQPAYNTSLDLDLLAIDDSDATGVKVTEWEHFYNYLVLACTSARTLALTSDLARDLHLDFVSVRDFDLDLARARAHDLVHDSAFARALDLVHASARACDLALEVVRDFESASASTHTSDLVFAISRVRASALDLPHGLVRTRAHDLALTRAIVLNLAHDLARASIFIFDLDCSESQRTPYILDLALLLALLSICTSFSAYDLALFISRITSQSFWKRLLVLRKTKQEPALEIQNTLNKGIKIYQRLERLKKRRQGEELACEGILIIKERKQDV